MARRTSIHIMLAVPSQTLLSGASRYKRAIGFASMKPLPPWHCSALVAIEGAREQLKNLAAGVATRTSSLSCSLASKRSVALATRSAISVAARRA